MLAHWIWLALLRGMNSRQKLELLEHFHGPEELYFADRYALKGMITEPELLEQLLNKDLSKANDLMRVCTEKGIGIIAFCDSAYPALLRNIDDPPLVLYYKGKIPAWELQPVIGVVGTRSASAYGLRTATTMGAQIAACGGIVVSGGARGIDTNALRGALAQEQITVSVQAGGLDHLYPKENTQLFSRILHNGCILSEYPPGTGYFKGNFLRRNRIISGISDAVLVVEAPMVSGALSTARWASGQGREVFAVPGNVDVDSAKGSNAIIGDIAKAAVDGWSVMREFVDHYPNAVKKAEPKYGVQRPQLPVISPSVKEEPKPVADKITVDKRKECPYSVIEKDFSGFSDTEQIILKALTDAPTPVDQLLENLPISSGEALSVLTKLSLKGVVKYHPGNLISLN